jgi:methylase of polypeptide subunit release factors
MSWAKDNALRDLLRHLQKEDYRFVTPTPATHARVIARRDRARDLRDALGWSLPFERGVLDAEIVALLEAAGALDEQEGLLRSRVRVSSLDDLLLLHSAYPTTQPDAVFFGPDSYRFAAFLRTELPQFAAPQHLVDIGAGSGIGGIVANRIFSQRQFKPGATVWMVDTNERALELAMANAASAPVCGGVLFVHGSGLAPVPETPDIVIANPPYIADAAHRAYRDGGGMHGAETSLCWAKEAAARLERGGAFLLYTGSAVIDGEHVIKAPLRDALANFDISYREIDPDVFGEELEREDYADVERIAVVGVVAVKR